VLFYSAADYWLAAWRALRQRALTIEVPIALGIAALAAWSTRDVLLGEGPGYFDSLAGLLFFLLAGRLFQQITHDRLVFDHDYQAFFPLAVARRTSTGEERVALTQLAVGDHLIVRHGELIPADARLISPAATIDYSFVTGESAPVERNCGAYLCAGGRQVAKAIEVEIVKEVSQSYLTSLWNQPAFRKAREAGLDSLTNRYSRRFTRIILAVAIGAAAFWWFQDQTRSLMAFVSVLIVACPCALALAAPFALGTAQRVLSRHGVFVKNTGVIETLARVNAAVFDKTGTLTVRQAERVAFEGRPLPADQAEMIFALAHQSTHPYSGAVAGFLACPGTLRPVSSFLETPGGGVEGVVSSHKIILGSAGWLRLRGVAGVPGEAALGSVVHLAIDGVYRGSFRITNALRPQAETLVADLARTCELALLSGDNEREAGKFREIFGATAKLNFNQSPLDKLDFVQRLQQSGKRVMMVGDGLNDAGALRQSDVGVAVVEQAGAFSPASDVIVAADKVPFLQRVLEYSRAVCRVVRASFFISSIYNIVGISLAASGQLSPVICAILMPLSSVTVVAFACGMAAWLGRRARLGGESEANL
ncbi:MAG TPA: HAD-IC family P-type ATPase, partial [Verrucomicrobiae bacterium]|nr:HAD-IC family P-type ATPase [Verrucomicrobiae bacterium]